MSSHDCRNDISDELFSSFRVVEVLAFSDIWFDMIGKNPLWVEVNFELSSKSTLTSVVGVTFCRTFASYDLK